MSEVVMDAAEFAVNVGGCLGSDLVGHDTFRWDRKLNLEGKDPPYSPTPPEGARSPARRTSAAPEPVTVRSEKAVSHHVPMNPF